MIETILLDLLPEFLPNQPRICWDATYVGRTITRGWGEVLAASLRRGERSELVSPVHFREVRRRRGRSRCIVEVPGATILLWRSPTALGEEFRRRLLLGAPWGEQTAELLRTYVTGLRAPAPQHKPRGTPLRDDRWLGATEAGEQLDIDAAAVNQLAKRACIYGDYPPFSRTAPVAQEGMAVWVQYSHAGIELLRNRVQEDDGLAGGRSTTNYGLAVERLPASAERHFRPGILIRTSVGNIRIDDAHRKGVVDLHIEHTAPLHGAGQPQLPLQDKHQALDPPTEELQQLGISPHIRAATAGDGSTHLRVTGHVPLE